MHSLIHKTLKTSTVTLCALTRARLCRLSISRFNSNPVGRMSSGRIFQLKLDPLTGNSEWIVVEEDEASDSPPQPVLASTSYLDMLNDSCRNRAFRQAIDKTIKKPCHVLDIGAGTGLLSMMAARAMDLTNSTVCSGSSEVRVTAVESYLPMMKLMKKVLRLNGMERKIHVINKRSDELKVGVDMNSRADILLQVKGTDENIVDTVDVTLIVTRKDDN